MLKKIRVDIENTQKAVKVPTGMRMLIRRCCHAVLSMEEFDGSAQVDVTLVDNEQIHQINLEQRHIDAPTDVLSVPLGENGEYETNPETGEKLLGNIVISLEKAQQQAKDYNHSFNREVGYLTVHSILHLLGYDHLDEAEQKRAMRAREEAILAEVELPRK